MSVQRPIEYDRWKEDIDLPRYAMRCGLRLNEKKTGHGYFVFHKGEGPSQETVIIKRGVKAWVFFNNTTGLHGTILDLAADHLGVSLRTKEGWAAVCRELREEAGGGRPEPPPLKYAPRPVLPGPDRAYVARSLAAARAVSTSPYLRRRGITEETLLSPRIRGTWRERQDGAILFPHRDADGLTGFEVKASGVSAFASRGRRALWHSNSTPFDARLVVCESALDAISHYQLHPSADTAYVSTAGALSRSQADLLRRHAEELGRFGTLVIATDNDFDKPPERNAGRLLATRIAELAREANPGLRIEFPVPPVGKDWNDVVQQGERRVRDIRGKDLEP